MLFESEGSRLPDRHTRRCGRIVYGPHTSFTGVVEKVEECLGLIQAVLMQFGVSSKLKVPLFKIVMSLSSFPDRCDPGLELQ